MPSNTSLLIWHTGPEGAKIHKKANRQKSKEKLVVQKNELSGFPSGYGIDCSDSFQHSEQTYVKSASREVRSDNATTPTAQLKKFCGPRKAAVPAKRREPS